MSRHAGHCGKMHATPPLVTFVLSPNASRKICVVHPTHAACPQSPFLQKASDGHELAHAMHSLVMVQLRRHGDFSRRYDSPKCYDHDDFSCRYDGPPYEFLAGRNANGPAPFHSFPVSRILGGNVPGKDWQVQISGIPHARMRKLELQAVGSPVSQGS